MINFSAGIILGLVVAVTTICAGIYVFWKKNKRNTITEGILKVPNYLYVTVMIAVVDSLLCDEIMCIRS